MRQRTYLVAGATGKQGGAVTRLLLARGHRVRIFTRKPGGSEARLLQRMGADVCPGGFEDTGLLARAMLGCAAAFTLSSFAEAGVEAEVRQGRSIIQAARRARLPHLVFSSMAGADRSTGVPHMESKGQIERFLARGGVPYTILAPVFLMENWLPIAPAAVAQGALAYPLPASRSLQMIAVDDVAAFACRVLENDREFENRRVEIAGDALTLEQIAAALGEALWRRLPYREVPLEVVWSRNELAGRACAWLDWQGTHVDVDRLRARYRELSWTSFGTWVLRQDWGALLAASPAARTFSESLPAAAAWALSAR